MSKQQAAKISGSERSNIDFLLAVAVAEFAEHGYEGVSVRTLADKCGVTTAVIYYHFGSKEELYTEVCRRKFDDMTYAMNRELGKVNTAEEKLSAFVGTLFDEWYRDNTLLLLTQRDVISALITPEQCLARSHYDKLMGLIHQILAVNFDRKLDEDFSFTFGALLYGYCTLMNFDQKSTSMSVSEFRRHRRAVLLKYAHKIWNSVQIDD